MAHFVNPLTLSRSLKSRDRPSLKNSPSQSRLRKAPITAAVNGAANIVRSSGTLSSVQSSKCRWMILTRSESSRTNTPSQFSETLQPNPCKKQPTRRRAKRSPPIAIAARSVRPIHSAFAQQVFACCAKPQNLPLTISRTFSPSKSRKSSHSR